MLHVISIMCLAMLAFSFTNELMTYFTSIEICFAWSLYFWFCEVQKLDGFDVACRFHCCMWQVL